VHEREPAPLPDAVGAKKKSSIWLGNELNAPNFYMEMWSFKHKKVYTLSNPLIFYTI